MKYAARLIERKENSTLHLFEFSCGCQKWTRLYPEEIQFGRSVIGCGDPKDPRFHDVGNLKSSTLEDEIDEWREQQGTKGKWP